MVTSETMNEVKIDLPATDGTRALGEEIAQFASVTWVAQLSKRLGLDLPHALACYAKGLSNFFQRVTLSVLQPKAHL